MERVYASWATALVTILVLLIAGAIVWLNSPGTLESYLVVFLLILVGVWVLLSAAGKLPLYRLR